MRAPHLLATASHLAEREDGGLRPLRRAGEGVLQEPPQARRELHRGEGSVRKPPRGERQRPRGRSGVQDGHAGRRGRCARGKVNNNPTFPGACFTVGLIISCCACARARARVSLLCVDRAKELTNEILDFCETRQKFRTPYALVRVENWCWCCSITLHGVLRRARCPEFKSTQPLPQRTQPRGAAIEAPPAAPYPLLFVKAKASV